MLTPSKTTSPLKLFPSDCITLYRYFGEDVEDHGEDCEVGGDPPASEPLHHVLRQRPHLHKGARTNNA